MRLAIRRDVPDVEIVEWATHYDFKEKAVSALCELLDNAFGEGAGNAWIVRVEWCRHYVRVFDNGCGIRKGELSVMVRLGDSFSRVHDSDIGQFGIGGKVGALYLGYHVHIESVADGRYYEHMVDWRKVKRTKVWPPTYDGVGVPQRQAHNKALRAGGTLITITDLHPDRVLRIEHVRDRLTRIYRPALASGRVIELKDADNEKVEVLSDVDTKIKLQHQVDLDTTCARMRYRIRAGNLTERGEQLHGIHVSYGHRVIHRYTGFAGARVMPPNFYAEVELSRDWKRCLTATKNSLATHETALLHDIAEKLAALLDALDLEGTQIQLDHIASMLTSNMTSLVKRLNRETEGDEGDDAARVKYKKGKRSRKGGAYALTKNPVPGQNATEEVEGKRGCVVKIASLGSRMWDVSVAAHDTVITLNKDNLAVHKIAEENWNPAALLMQTVNALIDHCIDNPGSADLILPSLAKALREGADHATLRQFHLHEALNYPNPMLDVTPASILASRKSLRRGKLPEPTP